MKPDDELCLCFHVTKRKVVNYLRVEKPSRASQLSQCGGAGTGCGWCRPFLERLFKQHRSQPEKPVEPTVSVNQQSAQNPSSIFEHEEEISVQQYARLRADYIQEKKKMRKKD